MRSIVSAERMTSPPMMPKAVNDLAKRGMTYERKVGRSLQKTAPPYATVELGVWFQFVTSNGNLAEEEKRGWCQTDILIRTPNFFIVGEIKLNWTPLAREKLDETYVPVVNAAYKGKFEVRPLVICKTLTPEAPRPTSFIIKASEAEEPLLHWTGIGPIIW